MTSHRLSQDISYLSKIFRSWQFFLYFVRFFLTDLIVYLTLWCTRSRVSHFFTLLYHFLCGKLSCF